MNLSKSIGGYFELELNKNEEYHKTAIKLNTGRNAFEYILRVNNYSKVYIPYYTCDVMLEPISKLKIKYEFYRIDRNFMPDINFENFKSEEALVYNNYFGICDKNLNEIFSITNNIIIDNSQSFYTKPINNCYTFYSARKFFGVPDGAYLFSEKKLDSDLEFDNSKNRTEHLLGRIEEGAEKYYYKFKENDESLIGQPIKKMSKLTHSLMKNIDYDNTAKIRNNNFKYLHHKLKATNEVFININSMNVPMVYPYLVKNGSLLKNILISNKIFVATYWPNVKEWDPDKDSYENYLVENLVTLPIDQRYSLKDMDNILYLIQR